MTTLIEDLQAILNPLAAGGSWYAVNTQEPPTYPYITFLRVDSTPNVSLGGASARQSTRVQIDVWAKRISQCESIRDAVDAAIQVSFPGWPTGNVPVLTADQFDFETKSFRVISDYSIWSVN
jgi:hypothetical protein